MANLTVERRNMADGIMILTPVGDIESHTFDRLDEAIAEIIDDGGKKLVVNMMRVRYISSAGLGVLIGAHSELTGSGGRLALVAPSEDVMHIFRTTKLDRMFTILDTTKDALDFMRR